MTHYSESCDCPSCCYARKHPQIPRVATRVTADSITDHQIRALMADCSAAGDEATVLDCLTALDHDGMRGDVAGRNARARCAVMWNYRAELRGQP